MSGTIMHYELWIEKQKKNDFGQLPKWPTGADCNSAVFRLRRFESFTAHNKFTNELICQCANINSADKYNWHVDKFLNWHIKIAEVAQSIEH